MSVGATYTGSLHCHVSLTIGMASLCRMEGVAPVSQGRVQLCNNFSSYIHNKLSENAAKLSDTKRDLNCIPHFHCVHLEFVCAAGSSLATCVVVSSAFRGSANNPSLSVHVLVISTKIPSPPPRGLAAAGEHRRSASRAVGMYVGGIESDMRGGEMELY